jgi:hypothetical protein
MTLQTERIRPTGLKIICPACDCHVFNMQYELYKVPAFMTQTGHDELRAVPYFQCAECLTTVDPSNAKPIDNMGNIITGK